MTTSISRRQFLLGNFKASRQAVHPPLALKAGIAPSCLAMNQVVCRTCGEACATGAIRFKLSAGAVARPEIDATSCTGCGACVGVCPVDAVMIGDALN